LEGEADADAHRERKVGQAEDPAEHGGGWRAGVGAGVGAGEEHTMAGPAPRPQLRCCTQEGDECQHGGDTSTNARCSAVSNSGKM